MELPLINDAIKVLNNGGIILYPTDTIWGIGCDATNEDAIQRIYALKKRPVAKGLIILVDSLEMLHRYVEFVHPRIDTLLAYHTRPVTIIYDEAKNLPKSVLAPDGSVAIRLVQDPFCQSLIRQFGKPIVSTSANISDEPFPTQFGAISSDILQGVDHVVKYRQDDKKLNNPSSIVRLGVDEELEFLRD